VAVLEAGDTLFCPALKVRKAPPNVMADRMRISLDNSYEAVGSPIAEHRLQASAGQISSTLA
jgi:hypothetical protein